MSLPIYDVFPEYSQIIHPCSSLSLSLSISSFVCRLGGRCIVVAPAPYDPINGVALVEYMEAAVVLRADRGSGLDCLLLWCPFGGNTRLSQRASQ